MQQQFIVSLGFLEGILFSASQYGSVRTELWNLKKKRKKEKSVDNEKMFQCGNNIEISVLLLLYPFKP